ncbi:peptidase family protein [Terriglobus roseus DSM 18391]|uniref:Peptidase family protein n=1 Tax=Terriglobus roseus (strain DSM 18391 / NRRL B-41598 / KBS 63) TaxID=926566 RepID=I3ZGY3_TERRK|nr:M42 family metallopeptidase [Terriglobus roseus]AFL88501.1 peptidase family protein [Terriglobus roseus DSM 18391]AFL88841.1 peptidase family protein [Terriglobus roseus DSM 18391]
MLRSIMLFCVLATPLTTLHAQTNDATVDMLKKLSDAPGPPGAEEPVRAIMYPVMKQNSSSIKFDGLGSVIAQQGSAGPRIMVDAHMDELGGMVRRVTPNGFLTMQMLGGWLDQALVDQRWIILGSKGPVHGVTGIRDIHVVPADERTRVYPRDSLMLDIGAKNAAEAAAMGIEPGDPVVPDAPFMVLNGTDNYLGKAWDDRIGCAVLLAAMQRTKGTNVGNQIFYVATTQEEIGLRGARTAAQLVKPDIGIAIEGGIVGDTPGSRPEETQAKLGGGPGIFLYDSSALANRKLVAQVKKVAAERKIPLQYDLVQGYGDDSAEMQVSNGGVPTINIVVPVRYTHAHNGIVNRKDFDQTVDFVVALLQSLTQSTVNDLRDFTPSN